ncbi:efflux RND transporter permease subunit [Pseudoteredinibacter isoporae]|nr:efflux RND transporter permease subunit [Pseudoteredinibacter isoporae]NIB25897.1 efflux RND transporter permease subunit [Pseudoteredinibacter isoporae]
MENQNGPIAWMTHHRVAPNLLMLFLIIGGLFVSYTIQKEFLPSESAAIVNIDIEYPAATPSEIEQSVVVPLENALQGMINIKKLSSSISQGSSQTRIELVESADRSKVYQDIKQAVDRINTFPQLIERPLVSLEEDTIEVLELAVFGDLSLFEMKQLGEQVRLLLLQDNRLSKIEMNGLPQQQIHIDIRPEMLKRYRIRLADIASRLRSSALEQSAGTVQSENGNILVSVNNKRYWSYEFSKIPILQQSDGSNLLLGDIATIREGFADSNQLVTFNGHNGILLNIYRSGQQTPSDVYDAYLDSLSEIQALLPPGADLRLTDNDATTYTQRLGLVLKNAFLGLLLVMITLALFLQHHLAFWIVIGLPTTFLGAIIFLPLFNVTINVISLFGFIIALGLVVDDAIIAGENIYARQQQGMDFQTAAIMGAKEMAVPLSFAILTNIIAFLPLLSMPGQIGRIFGSAPIVVVICFVISWVEALFILPAHLAASGKSKTHRFDGIRQRCAAYLDHFIHHRYRRFLQTCLKRPLLSLALPLCIASISLSYALSGRMGFSVFPALEGEWAVATAELPNDASMAQLKQVRDHVEAAALRTVAKSGGDTLLQSRQAEIDGNSVSVGLYLTPTEVRPISSHELVRRWQQNLGPINHVRSIEFDAERGGGGGNNSRLSIELRHQDGLLLARAIRDAEQQLADINGLSDVKSSYSEGIPQWDVSLSQHGLNLGLNTAMVSEQLRGALYGNQAMRLQRQSSEVSVLVRMDRDAIRSEADIKNLPIQTESGGELPLHELAELKKSSAPASISRRDAQRIETITARANNPRQLPILVQTIEDKLFPTLRAKYPGIVLQFSGNQEEASEGLSNLSVGTVLALLAIFAALAIPMRSYSQPLLIMSIIPFAAVGAILGHMVLQLSISMVSIMGILALSGIVINNSLILIEFANRAREGGKMLEDAIITAACQRFRPIFLTSITTFFGLAPMVFESSRQAQMLIPMAVSIGFGILFTSVVCLSFLPVLYVQHGKLTQKKDEPAKSPARQGEVIEKY